jgi:16S rRNA (adenine1518-N6/adenine1519-N6)-dimethyltransferase
MAALHDEVDIYDNPTGRRITRDEAHGNYLPHRVSAIYVFDEQGRLYVQVHKKSGGLLDNSVGGHVDAGETYAEAAKREGEEELGLHGVELHELKTGLYSDEGRYHHLFGLYECQPKNWKFVPNDEVEQIIPMTLEEIVKQMNADPERFTAGFIRTLREYIKLKDLPLNLTAHKTRPSGR